ncbi:LysR family transcriptional regulator [Lacticaseibacillus saniviri]|uniref:LysR family transcriptional regulator n=1 Tax=Lacticaseibacillus saniviri TaxID=931533 RepID=UPI001EDE5850|nr:LysR family transcriptional regulator [Lacticaseibacillus saniviri]
MDTQKLATFVDLATTKNYSETAARIFSTQATVSKQIMALEKKWGIKLFTRAHRQVTLTAAGEAVLPAVKRVLAETQVLADKVAAQRLASEQTLVIKGIPSISQYQAFKIITEFTKKYPDINLKFSEVETDQLESALTHDRADIIFTRLFHPIQAKYTALINEEDYFVILMPKSNRLAAQASVKLEMLVHESFLLLDSATNLFDPVKTMLMQAGITPQITYEGRRIDLILGMLNRGVGVSIMMRKSFDLTNYKNVVAIPIEPKAYSHLAFVKQRNKHSQAIDTFWHFANQSI